MRHLLEIDDLTPAEISTVLDLATHPAPPQVLGGRGGALVFEKPSARTRNSMEMAVTQLGGHPVYIRPEEVGIDTRETAEDVANTLACFHAFIGARVFKHSVVERMAAVNAVPVVNMLSDEAHPLQALADLLTIKQEFGSFDGLTVAYVGDANNVTRSLALGCAAVGMPIRVAAPSGYRFSDVDTDRIAASGAQMEMCERPQEAIEGADVVYTDVWTSMGQEDEKEERLRQFEGFTINNTMMSLTTGQGIFLHCLPAHRGEEVAGEVIDGERSRVWPQAANRMHAARGLLAFLLGAGTDNRTKLQSV